MMPTRYQDIFSVTENISGHQAPGSIEISRFSAPGPHLVLISQGAALIRDRAFIQFFRSNRILKKVLSDRNKIQVKACKKTFSGMPIMTARTTTIRTLLYVHVVLNGVIFRQIYDIAPYARHFLPVKIFPKYYFNKLCFQLPQNITWTDE